MTPFGTGIGTWVKKRLLEAGASGLSPSDLFVELKQATSPPLPGMKFPSTMRAHSWYRFFYWFTQLEWIVPTGETTTGYSKGDLVTLKAPKAYYRITPQGRAASDEDWANPLGIVHPEWSSSGERKLEYMKRWREQLRAAGLIRPTRGRPRRAEAVEAEVEEIEEEEEEGD